jgi:hypothetical protein
VCVKMRSEEIHFAGNKHNGDNVHDTLNIYVFICGGNLKLRSFVCSRGFDVHWK